MKLNGPLAQDIHAFDGETRVHAGHKIPRVWFIVADRQAAHIYRKIECKLEFLLEARAIANDQPEGTDLKNQHDPRDQNLHHGDRAFMHAFAHWLDKAEKQNVFDRLVIVAPPHTLGDMRAAFSRTVDSRVMAEINKDFMSMPAHKIYEQLSEFVWF